ncbi:MAG TPA: DUF3267 domain-containing protein [Thermomicrobiales bacterium]|nr:DUF3267 domain-containing protein [Thermomicrobiales bacterium]
MAQPDAVKTRKQGRIRPWIGEPPREVAPEVTGYRLDSHQRFDMLQGSIAGMVLIPFWFVFFSVLIGLVGGRYMGEFAITIANMLLGAVIALVVVPALHEAVHGLAAMLCGVRPSYGIGPGFAYTTFPDPVGKRAYLAIGLAPLVVLSLIGFPLAAVWDSGAGAVLFFMVVNAAGAVGDLWMSWRIALQPPHALFVDLADGFAVLIPDAPEPVAP